MPRPRPDDDRSAGQDSFLDVVTNIVGILIILVMIIGARVRQISLEPPAPVSTEPPAALTAEVAELAQTLRSAETEIEGLQEQVRLIGAAIEGAAQARLDLATAVAAAKRGVEAQKKAADTARLAAAERAARRRGLEDAIKKCTVEEAALAHAPATTKEVLAFPTPIGRTVNGEEIHFRIAQGRIAYVPFEELFDLAKEHFQRRSSAVPARGEKIMTVGPTEGFSLDIVVQTIVDQARGQVLTRSREFVMRPVEVGVGEPVANALAASSLFRRKIAGIKPDTTITLWVYPDSFEGYRAVRAELYRLGIATAARPLPEGAPIGGSNEGSKSVAQ